MQDLHSGSPERVLAASEEPRSDQGELAEAETLGRLAAGFQAAVSPVVPPRARQGCSGSADPLVAEVAARQPAPIAAQPPTR